MKPAFEQTPQRPWESFTCEVVRGASYNATWHFHPEFQITLVLKSSGYRLVGDNITPLHAGDLVLVGANLPHVWHQEDSPGPRANAVHAIVVRFLKTFLGNGFLEIPEAAPTRRLLARASRGLCVTGRIRETAAGLITELPHAGGLQRIAKLLSILDLLAASKELVPIASAQFSPKLSGHDQGRVERVIGYIQTHLGDPMDREAVAAEAHLTVSAFSRFFKLRTGKTLPEYTNELRVGRACQLLADERLKVADIAEQCGFGSLANFNRTFRRINSISPREYREQIQRSAA